MEFSYRGEEGDRGTVSAASGAAGVRDGGTESFSVFVFCRRIELDLLELMNDKYVEQQGNKLGRKPLAYSQVFFSCFANARKK